MVDGSRHLLTMWPPEKETSKTPGIGLVNYKWALAKAFAICLFQRLSPVLLQLLTFDTPRREFSMESETLCSKKTGGTGL